jgi:hypothetical protein
VIWYAGFGSNLSRDRFGRYLAGCRDRAAPRREIALRFPGRLSFAGESTIWGGGMAFLDPDGDAEVVARGYLLTEAQLDDVAEQERRYDGLAAVAQCDGLPVVALTSRTVHEPAAPSAAYLRTILTGLTDAILAADEAIAYLLRADGVDLLWDEPAIRALLEQPPAERG